MLTLSAALAATATVLATAFACALGERWWARRRPHEAAWCSALVVFALASLALLMGETLGWPAWLFRVFYLLGGIICVPLLALGSVVFLTKSATTARIAIWSVVIGCSVATGMMLSTPLVSELPSSGLPEGREMFGVMPRAVAATASGVGSLVVAGGAVFSAIRVRRVRVVVANLLIAAGTFIVAAKGAMPDGLTESGRFALALALGVGVLLAGFLVATTGTAPATPTIDIRDETPARPRLSSVHSA